MHLGLALVIWACAALVTLLIFWRRNLPSCGLLIAYLAGFAQLHWVAVTLYLNPAYSFYDIGVVRAGFQQSLYAVLAFMTGSIFIAPCVLRFVLAHQRARKTASPDPLLPKLYIAIGALCFFLLSTPLGSLPSVTSLISSGEQFTVVGLCLSCWTAVQRKKYATLAVSIGASLALPYITLVKQGFMGYGAAAATLVLAFAGNLIRPRWLFFVGGILLSYFGLSLYVGYMRDRPEIRAVVWSGHSMEDRIDRIRESLSRFEWFDPQNRVHCELIDGRLNQNMFVGATVNRLEDTNYYAHGQTIWEGILALIPRAIWRDKPMEAGSGHLVGDYTGIRLAEGTSFGVGQVLEFYINFGTVGVVCGFLLLGTLVSVCDWVAGRALVQGNWPIFAVWLLLGISLLNIIGSLVETFSSAAASLIIATLVNRGFGLAQQTRKSLQDRRLSLRFRQA